MPPQRAALIEELRPWSDELLDDMLGYDLISASPAIEFSSEKKKGNKEKGQKDFHHTPKVTITWYVKGNFMQSFLETVVPTIFVVRAAGAPPTSSNAYPLLTVPRVHS